MTGTNGSNDQNQVPTTTTMLGPLTRAQGAQVGSTLHSDINKNSDVMPMGEPQDSNEASSMVSLVNQMRTSLMVLMRQHLMEIALTRMVASPITNTQRK